MTPPKASRCNGPLRSLIFLPPRPPPMVAAVVILAALKCVLLEHVNERPCRGARVQRRKQGGKRPYSSPSDGSRSVCSSHRHHAQSRVSASSQAPMPLSVIHRRTAAALLVLTLIAATPISAEPPGPRHSVAAELAATQTHRDGRVGPDVVYSSWQVDHPVLTAIGSTLSLSVWPRQFGDDVRERTAEPVMNQGFGRDAFRYIRAASFRIFESARWVTTVTVLICAALLVAWHRSTARVARAPATTEDPAS